MQWNFRPLASSDMNLFQDWLTRPHVAEWWETSDVVEEVADFYAASSDESVPHWCFIAELNGEPTGFIQWYAPAAFHNDGWWTNEHDWNVRGIDQFLASAHHLGKGIGTSMVKAFVAQLFSDPNVTRVQTDPSPLNARAIRCYEKAGFRAHGEIETPDGRALLMYCERPSRAK
ncbi:MAG: GNAT family N-acetyltransferase [Gemmatimonas sp.]